jgi:hypothetical protein
MKPARGQEDRNGEATYLKISEPMAARSIAREESDFAKASSRRIETILEYEILWTERSHK